VKISKFVTAFVASAILSFQSQAYAGTTIVTVSNLNNGDNDQLCKTVWGESSFSSFFDLNQRGAICKIPSGVEFSNESSIGSSIGLDTSISGQMTNGKTVLDYAVDKLIPLSALCKFKNGTHTWYDWQSQSCVAEQYVDERQPQLAVLGPIGHNQFWTFCSGSGYRSYYDQGYAIQCGRNEWVAGQPEGDYYDYQNVCRYVYGNGVFYSDDNKACSTWQ
jgi:hypothetical protein